MSAARSGPGGLLPGTRETSAREVIGRCNKESPRMLEPAVVARTQSGPRHRAGGFGIFRARRWVGNVG